MPKAPDLLSKTPDAAIEELVVSPRDRLIELWRAMIGSEPPRGISVELMRAALAHEVQLTTTGGVPAKLERRLKRSATGAGAGCTRNPRSSEPLPGTRLVREWNGLTHVVDVTSEGYVWDGATYRSLSAIAREITGARWSGPRFFGLTQEAA